jgi:hypothetical protein
MNYASSVIGSRYHIPLDSLDFIHLRHAKVQKKYDGAVDKRLLNCPRPSAVALPTCMIPRGVGETLDAEQLHIVCENVHNVLAGYDPLHATG